MNAFGFGVRFCLGLGAPAARRCYPDCTVRAARGHDPDLLRGLLHLYRGEATAEVGTVTPVKPGCAHLTLAERGASFFFKEFPRRHRGHDLERRLHLSRVDRAWRAAHLLPHLGVHTPAAVGTVQAPDGRGSVTEYLATEWLEGGRPFPVVFAAGEHAPLLREFAALLRHLHTSGLYTRDLVKNVLVKQTEGARTFWLTDLDGLHPLRRANRRRRLFHLRQLAFYCPLTDPEAHLVRDTYLSAAEGPWAEAVLGALRSGSGAAS